MPDLPLRVARTAVSYLPSESLLGLRSIGDMPNRLRRLPHEPDFAVFGPFDGPNATFLDIGANRGQSIDSIRLFAPDAHIVAFEPNGLLAAHLESRYDHDAVVVHNVGIGDHAGVLELHTPGYGHTLYDTRAGTTSEAAASFLSPEHFFLFKEGRCRVVRSDIEIRTLDSFDLSPTVAKVDVEGADFAVIEGAMATITSHLPLLMIEYPSNETSAALHDLGYEPRVLRERSLHLDTKHALNTIFVTAEHRQRLDDHGFRCV